LDNENINSVDAYQIGFLQAEYNLKIKKIEINLRASVDNIWAVEYQVIANRPMPGRWFSFGLMVGNL
jgi:outer membrane cobalamin receptor